MKKIKLRELTNKERVLITILVMVILFWLSFKYIIDPQKLEISTLESELNNYSLHIEENNRMLNNEQIILEEVDRLSVEKENIEKEFFKSLNQPNIIYILNELLLENDIEMDSISFSKPVIETLNEIDIKKMDVLIPFKGSFQSLKETIKSLEEEDRKIIIDHIDIEKDEEKEIAGNISLAIYSLSGIVDSEEKSLPIEITTTNKFNPFIPYEGYVDPNKAEVEEESFEDTLENEDEYEDKAEDLQENKDMYTTYKAVKGDNISYISMEKYGTEKYVDEILSLNGMKRSSILPIGKEIKLMEIGK